MRETLFYVLVYGFPARSLLFNIPSILPKYILWTRQMLFARQRDEP